MNQSLLQEIFDALKDVAYDPHRDLGNTPTDVKLSNIKMVLNSFSGDDYLKVE